MLFEREQVVLRKESLEEVQVQVIRTLGQAARREAGLVEKLSTDKQRMELTGPRLTFRLSLLSTAPGVPDPEGAGEAEESRAVHGKTSSSESSLHIHSE